MSVAFKGASWTDPDSVPLMVMQTMLGEWLGGWGGAGGDWGLEGEARCAHRKRNGADRSLS